MKKRLAVFLLVFSTLVLADIKYDSTYPAVNTSDKTAIPRFQDFPLDNIHILRLQEASVSLGRNVSALQELLAEYQQGQTNQILEIQSNIGNLQREIEKRTAELQSAINSIPQPEQKTPFIFLFASNIILFLVVIILLIIIHKKPLPQDHLHPAPPELVDYIKMSRKNNHELRLELLKKGWKPIFIENAMKAARR